MYFLIGPCKVNNYFGGGYHNQANIKSPRRPLGAYPPISCTKNLDLLKDYPAYSPKHCKCFYN